MSLQPDTGGERTESVRWSLNLFADFRLSRAGKPQPLSAKRERVLLAYLALSPNYRQPRRKLATLLWDNADDETTQDNLRTCVWGLRKGLSDTEHRIVKSDDDWISLDPSAFDVDAWDFYRLANQSDMQSLERAAKIYSGEFLDGLAIDSEEFETWLRQESTRFRNLAIDVLDKLTERLAEAGKTEQAIQAGLRLVRLDPLHEKGIRILMRLHVQTGRRGVAVQLYRSLSETLRTELNAQPEDATRLAYVNILGGPGVGDVAQSNVPAVAATGSPPHASTGAIGAIPPEAVNTSIASKARSQTAAGIRKHATISAAAIAFLFAVVVMLGVTYLPNSATRKVTPDIPLPERPSLAVLPWNELGGDANLADFTEALTGDITNALSIIPGIFVIDRNSTLVFRNTPIKVQQVAKELGVRYVLEGSVQKAADRVRISAELIDALSGKQLWADRYDREAKDVFALQDEITLAIITALRVHITEGDQERISLIHGTQNLQAWMVAGQGLQLLRSLTREDNTRARELYTQAASLDSKYPGAWDGLAWSYLLSVRFGWSVNPQADFNTAQELAQKTLALDPMRGRTYALLGFISLMMNDHKQAVDYGDKAMVLDPNGADITALHALTLTYTENPAASIDFAAKAMRLSPYYPDWYRWVLGRGYRLSGRYTEAEGVLTRDRNGEPVSVPNLVELAAAYVQSGNLPRAKAVAAKILMIEPKFSTQVWTRTPPYQNAITRQREIDILKRAGLPD